MGLDITGTCTALVFTHIYGMVLRHTIDFGASLASGGPLYNVYINPKFTNAFAFRSLKTWPRARYQTQNIKPSSASHWNTAATCACPVHVAVFCA